MYLREVFTFEGKRYWTVKPIWIKDTEVMVDSEILKAIKINTKLSSASWKDDWKSYFDLSQFHLLSLSR